ncbi:hypothetical protein J3459_011371 [Metarhizium acridum]|nr:hypothetical protein J3459_011371 [Metarhizium acridum]
MSMKTRTAPPKGTCIAPDSNTFWTVLQEFKNNLGDQNDLHLQMDKIHHSVRHQGDDGPVVVTESVVQELLETVHSAIAPSYQSAASSPRDGKMDSTGNYSKEDIALLQSIFSTKTSAGESAARAITCTWAIEECLASG